MSRQSTSSTSRAKITLMSSETHFLNPPTWWLARIPEVFSDFGDQIAPGSVIKVGEGDYRRIASRDVAIPMAESRRIFCRWNLPIHHAWPCHPEKIDGFIEKAAQAIAEKFASHHPRALLIGAFEPHTRNGYFRKLASNLRGRALQLIPDADATATMVGPDDPVLYVLLGSTGMFCGLHTPRLANGYHPGGTRFIRQSGDGVLSRAGAKISEALHHMALFDAVPIAAAHWLELGACPGGMTSELLRHGYRVTAIDRAPLDPALDAASGLTFSRANVATWCPPQGATYDALLCDMNGPAVEAFAQVTRLAQFLRPDAPVVFTLKTTGAEDFESIVALQQKILATAEREGLAHLQTTHLTYNRREFTMFLKRVFIGSKERGT